MNGTALTWQQWQWMLLVLPAALAGLFAIRPWRKPSPLRWAALAALLCGIGLLCLSRADPVRLVADRSGHSRWVVLQDVSPSITPADQTRQQGFLRELRAVLPQRTTLEVIPFGATPRAGQATRLRPALLASHGAERVFLLSDGLFEERLAELLALAESLDVRIELPAHLPGARRLLIARALTLREKPSATRPARFTLTYEATYDGQAQLTIEARRAGTKPYKQLARSLLQVRPGTQQASGRIAPLAAGLYLIRARLESPGATAAAHQRKALLVRIGQTQRILLVSAAADGGTVGRALAASRHRVDRIRPEALPTRRETLLRYREVVLAGVTLPDISSRAAATLTDWVRQDGGGLLFTEAREALEQPDWSRSPLAELFPLSPGQRPPTTNPQEPEHRKNKRKRPPDRTRRNPQRRPGTAAQPVLALMLVIDRSGSMEGKKLRLAKEAAIACVDTLQDDDVIGVVAFDSNPHWLVRPTPARRHAQITQLISRLEADGDTHILKALQTTARMLKTLPCPIKHIVLLSDGHTEPALFRTLVEGMAAEKITLSAIGIGKDFDQRLLQQLARWGQGRFNFAIDPEQIPQYVISETKMALRRAAPHREQNKKTEKKQRTTPVPKREPATQPRKATAPKRVNQVREVFRAPFLVGLGGRYPALGPVAPVRVRPGATVFLETTDRTPVLAAWRSGLGRVGIFNGTLTGAGAGDWPDWRLFPRFQAQLTSFLLAQAHLSQPHQLRGRSSWPSPDRLRLDLWISGPDGEPRDLPVTVQTAIGSDTLTARPLRLGPGRYRLESAVRDQFPVWRAEAGGVVRHYLAARPLPVEGRRLAPDGQLLRQLARETGGAVAVRPELLPARQPRPRKRKPLDTTPLLAAGLVVWCLSIGLWRLAGRRGIGA